MNDLEVTKLCAEAMGHETDYAGWALAYNPLHNDAQAMALVKKFRLLVDGGNAQWCVHGDSAGSGVINDDLNRAIVECVAKMQAAKKEV